MTNRTWEAVDHHYTSLLISPDEEMNWVLENAAAAGLPAIHVSPLQGKHLMLLAMLQHANHVLEVGTLAGYSTLWLAKGMSNIGKIVTLESVALHANVARENFRKSAMYDRIELIEGPAIQTLPAIAPQHPFDMVFIDADKENYPHYLELILPLCRPGTLIVSDNMVRNGEVTNEQTSDSHVRGVRLMGQKLAANPNLISTVLQTVGSKGYDGFALTLVADIKASS